MHAIHCVLSVYIHHFTAAAAAGVGSLGGVGRQEDHTRQAGVGHRGIRGILGVAYLVASVDRARQR